MAVAGIGNTYGGVYESSEKAVEAKKRTAEESG